MPRLLKPKTSRSAPELADRVARLETLVRDLVSRIAALDARLERAEQLREELGRLKDEVEERTDFG